MLRRTLAGVTVLVTALSITGASADAPVPELGVVNPEVAKVVSGDCVEESVFDVNYTDSIYGNPNQVRPAWFAENCSRLKIVFGPILMKPGQNDVLIQPVTFEKPLFDGYITRFKPDMVTATGEAPPVKDAHLHHGTWLNPGQFGSGGEFIDVAGQQIPNPGRSYGRGPWIASGEEKTVVIWPEGYDLKVKATDAWLFLHMIHNATAQAYPVWVTYDIDFIPADVAEAPREYTSTDTSLPSEGLPNIINTEGIWLDVGDCSWSDKCEKDAFNPIFNIQRGFGKGAWNSDSYALEGACVFPRENCAQINTLAEVSAQQGEDIGVTYDEITINKDGTLVMMGGHLHNGGLRDDVYLVRDGEAELIHISDAYYFDHNFDPYNADLTELATNPDANLVGADPVSWDFVMTGVTADVGWKVNVNAGDKIRLEGIYDSDIASWYEQMGIVMAWFAPADTPLLNGGTLGQVGVDIFDPNVEQHLGVNTVAIQPGTMPDFDLPGEDAGDCTNSSTTLCVRGQMTHPRIPGSGEHWSCNPTCRDVASQAQDGPALSDIPMVGFGYGPTDMGVIEFAGVPTVKVGETVTFWNLDTADYMWHTVTRCADPCTGSTSASYPVADGAYDDLLTNGVTTEEMTLTTILGDEVVVPAGSDIDYLLDHVGPDPMDFDSGQVGYGTGANNKLSWDFTPTRPGTFTFYCRIHPPMRGAIRVLPA